MKIILQAKYLNDKESNELTLDKEMIIGRTNKADWIVKDPEMSSIHCRLSLKNHKLEIFDEDSKNGVYLNGILIDHAEVFVGDVIKIGSTIIKIDEEKNSPEILNAFRFSGSPKSRIYHKLRADFTNAKFKKQKTDSTPKSNRVKPIEKRGQKAKKKIIFLARIYDLILLVIIYLLSSHFLSLSEDYVILLVVLVTYLLINHKLMAFSLGEKLAGVESLLEDEE
jgi:hypothetical protein